MSEHKGDLQFWLQGSSRLEHVPYVWEENREWHWWLWISIAIGCRIKRWQSLVFMCSKPTENILPCTPAISTFFMLCPFAMFVAALYLSLQALRLNFLVTHFFSIEHLSHIVIYEYLKQMRHLSRMWIFIFINKIIYIHIYLWIKYKLMSAIPSQSLFNAVRDLAFSEPLSQSALGGAVTFKFSKLLLIFHLLS